MYLTSDFDTTDYDVPYILDSLGFALSISPNSIPGDDSIGIEMERTTDFEDITRYKVSSIISNLGESSEISLISCSLDDSAVSIVVEMTSTSDYYKFSF